MTVRLGAAVFLDRDGVLTEPVFNPSTGEHESPHRLADLALCPNVFAPLRSLSAAGFSLFVVSNQPSYAKGKASLEDLSVIAREVSAIFERAGITLTDSYYCYHHPAGIVPSHSGPCACRKPAPFFLLRAQARYGLDLSQSWMVGDRDSDVECGQRAGCKTIRVTHRYAGNHAGKRIPNYVVGDLAEAAERIIAAMDREGRGDEADQ